jgi:ribonuclease J
LDALFISHSHIDHYGLYRYIKSEIPVYLSEGAKGIIDISDIFLSWKTGIKNCRILDTNENIQIGDMGVTSYLMDHSAFGAFAYLIESGSKKIFYSGDFRAHGRKRKAFLWFLRNAPQDINCLIMEGTSLGRRDELLKDEEEVEFKIVETIKKANNLKLALFSPQNIDRLVSFYKAALRTDSILVIDIYAAYLLEAICKANTIPKPGCNNLKIYYPDKQVKFLIRKGYRETIVEKYREHQVLAPFIDKHRRRIILMFRPSMIEDLDKIGNLEGAILIYSLWDGYLKEESFRPIDTSAPSPNAWHWGARAGGAISRKKR